MSHILIVEDDPAMSRLYERVFTMEGHDVVLATDGEDALKKVKEKRPALLLLDIMMPKMNGFQVLEKLKENPDTKNIPVIMLTNLAGPQDMENALSRGAIKYLIKSELEPKQLSGIIKEIMAGLPAAVAPTAPVAPAPPPVEPASTQVTTTVPVETPGYQTAPGSASVQPSPAAPPAPAEPAVPPIPPPAPVPPAAQPVSPETPKT